MVHVCVVSVHACGICTGSWGGLAVASLCASVCLSPSLQACEGMYILYGAGDSNPGPMLPPQPQEGMFVKVMILTCPKSLTKVVTLVSEDAALENCLC